MTLIPSRVNYRVRLKVVRLQTTKSRTLASHSSVSVDRNQWSERSLQASKSMAYTNTRLNLSEWGNPTSSPAKAVLLNFVELELARSTQAHKFWAKPFSKIFLSSSISWTSRRFSLLPLLSSSAASASSSAHSVIAWMWRHPAMNLTLVEKKQTARIHRIQVAPCLGSYVALCHSRVKPLAAQPLADAILHARWTSSYQTGLKRKEHVYLRLSVTDSWDLNTLLVSRTLPQSFFATSTRRCDRSFRLRLAWECDHYH